MPTVKPIPKDYHSLNLYIPVADAAKAIHFYKAAFGAIEKSRFDLLNGKIMHAELKIGDSTLQLSDDANDPESGLSSPLSLPATTCIIHLYVEDADTTFKAALQAGAKVKRELATMFWGDRYGQLVDPFGHLWSIACKIEDLSPEEIKQRANELAKQLSTGAPCEY